MSCQAAGNCDAAATKLCMFCCNSYKINCRFPSNHCTFLHSDACEEKRSGVSYPPWVKPTRSRRTSLGVFVWVFISGKKFNNIQFINSLCNFLQFLIVLLTINSTVNGQLWPQSGTISRPSPWADWTEEGEDVDLDLLRLLVTPDCHTLTHTFTHTNTTHNTITVFAHVRLTLS